MSRKQNLVDAVHTLLRPIVRLLMALGFNARDFQEVAKIVYTEVATQDYGRRGRPANISRTALLTGLTRREVTRLRQTLTNDPKESADQMVPVGRVLSMWHQEPKYLDAQGAPKALPLETTFMRLVNECRGDLPATTLIKALEEHNAINIRRGYVQALSRYFMPVELEVQAIDRFGRVMGDMGNVITQNMLPKNGGQTKFEGRAVREGISSASQDAFQKFLERRAMSLLEEADDWLRDHADPGAEDVSRLGVGVYTIGELE